MDVFETTRPGDYLLRLARSGAGSAYKRLAASLLDIRPGDVVLDLGCGPGADLAAFAEAAGEGGRVIGIDHDRVQLEKARATAPPRADVREGDIHALDLPDASADRAHTDRVLQHVADPVAVVAELRRVLRPGGVAVLAEPDWDTLAIDHPDLATARAYTRYVTERAVRNATVGRSLARYGADAGFEVRDVVPVTTVFRDVTAADQVLGLHRVTGRAVADGYLTEEAARDWLAHLANRPFFGSATLHLVVLGG
ncbi:methyltransferase domain-containing protein [Amycolatopsis sp. CA-230715]|uniref:methyltransferase domain-containing protein n=1 Tax=Amycolatopsis sp. CA-230715 TaxID=2745196 RepID=UPI001C01E40D|nr:methyltransferase domain-containing protein [Amycolatopsis sp. CA-230715]QWF76830.1 Ubiquinone/menaquinone biosynthesis C-methyltransferase UbiE [Amycolatopsis sp. CA-230715]